MKRKFSYSMKEMNYRLLMMGRPIWKYIGISTLASTLGALSHMGLMGFGALWLLAAAGFCDGAGIYAALTAVCAVLIAVCRYLEGVFSHLGAYGILAKMRVHLFDAIDRIAPAYLIGRETGDVMNIAVSDIETLEYFFAHTIGPMFTVILLPTTTVVIAWCVNPLYALVLIPIYLIISVVLPLAALKAGRGIGMRYREQLGDLKSKILESVYSIRDIQIFGAGQRRMQVVEQANGKVNQAALGLTLHRQTIASFPNFFVYLARILILVCAGVLASRGINHPVGTIALSFAATASLSSWSILIISSKKGTGSALPGSPVRENPRSCVCFCGFMRRQKGRSSSMASRLSRSALRNCISVLRFWNRIPTCLTRRSRKILVLQSRMLRWKKSKQQQNVPESQSLLKLCQMAMTPIWGR